MTTKQKFIGKIIKYMKEKHYYVIITNRTAIDYEKKRIEEKEIRNPKINLKKERFIKNMRDTEATLLKKDNPSFLENFLVPIKSEGLFLV